MSIPNTVIRPATRAAKPRTPARPPFPNYTQIPQRVPQPLWYVARLISVGISFGIILTLFIRPDVGVFIFWRLVIPFLPILFFTLPGLWRNICPMAALNQTPRLFGFTRAITLPNKAKEYAYVVGIVLFFLIVPTRKVLFNSNGPALGILLVAVFTTAFVGGYFFKGKSGWCSSICPLLPVQRLYGQSPFVNIPNNHCKPCVGCAKNCYDFNPAVANMADQYDKDRHYANYRRFFAAAFPGLILAFYTIPDPPAIPVLQMYGQIVLYIMVSVGLFFLLDTFVRFTSVQLVTLYGALALNLYYYFNIPTFANTLNRLFNVTVPQPILLLANGLVLLLTVIWILRTVQKEPIFIAQSLAGPAQVKQSGVLKSSMVLHQSKITGNPEVTFAPEMKRILAAPGVSILEIAESNGMKIEAGCRMGVCGADPVAILKGMDCLSAPNSDEQSTLERLGLADNTRMACCARVQGPVSVSLQPEKAQVRRRSVVAGFKYDKSVKSVVVIGNGIAGVTAADHIRRRHPECTIHLIARETHPLYNRMGLSRLIYGRSAMHGLYLMSESWYEDHQIETALNTRVIKIDRQNQRVILAEGDSLSYDRLILAMGSTATIPPIRGYGMDGTFVLREADDAMAMRAFVQEHQCRTAVVAGGGLLGLEAAYALHKLGLETVVLERSTWLMRRQLDERGAFFLREYLAGLGVNVLTQAEIYSVRGTDRVHTAILKDERTLPCDVFLVCAGIKSQIDLARDCDLEVRQGIVVDEHMRTSDPNILAAGDVVEWKNQVHGLWAVAVEQAEVAAVNAIGGDKVYTGVVPSTMLKVAGVDLMSVGQFDPVSGTEEVIVFEDSEQHKYRKLVISGGQIIGAILLGYPLDAPVITAAVKEKRDILPYLAALRAGKWEVLKQ